MAKLQRYLILSVILHVVCITAALRAEAPPPMVDVQYSVYSNDRLSGVFLTKSLSKGGPMGAPVELKATSHSRSPAQRYHGPATFDLFTLVPGPDGVTFRQPVCQLVVPPEIKEALFVIVVTRDPAALGGRRYQGLVYDDSLAAFPAGSARILNLTPVSYAGVAGKDGITVPQGPVMTAPISKIGNRRLGLALRLSDTYVPVVDQGYEVTSEQRLLMVLLPPFRANSLDVRARIVKDEPRVETIKGSLAGL